MSLLLGAQYALQSALVVGLMIESFLLLLRSAKAAHHIKALEHRGIHTELPWRERVTAGLVVGLAGTVLLAWFLVVSVQITLSLPLDLSVTDIILIPVFWAELYGFFLWGAPDAARLSMLRAGMLGETDHRRPPSRDRVGQAAEVIMHAMLRLSA